MPLYTIWENGEIIASNDNPNRIRKALQENTDTCQDFVITETILPSHNEPPTVIHAYTAEQWLEENRIDTNLQSTKLQISTLASEIVDFVFGDIDILRDEACTQVIDNICQSIDLNMTVHPYSLAVALRRAFDSKDIAEEINLFLKDQAADNLLPPWLTVKPLTDEEDDDSKPA